MFNKKKKIDTSIDGYRSVGIDLTEEQYVDLCLLNKMITSKQRKDIPVFNMLVLMKYLGLLPKEMTCDVACDNSGNESHEDIYHSLESKFGKIKEDSL